MRVERQHPAYLRQHLFPQRLGSQADRAEPLDPTRGHNDPQKVSVDLDFDSVSRAEDFRETLAAIWRTPQSREHLVDHSDPVLVDVMEQRTLG
ncbi:MAG: hypothetical protein ACRDWY_10460 [Actinomycetes bacterium]